jgi:hypothetical protein
VNELRVDDPNPNALIFTTPSTPTFPIIFSNGRNGTVITKFPDTTGDKKYRVDIFVDPPLKYYDGNKPPKAGIPEGVPDYNVNGSDINSSTWTGVGKTGRVLELKANEKKNNKMDW